MKKLISFAMLLVVFFIARPVFAQIFPPQPVGSQIDAERSAQVFAGLPIDHYRGWVSFRRVAVDGQSFEWVSENFVMELDDSITHLEVGGRFSSQVVVDVSAGDRPLDGLPKNTVGVVREFYLGLDAYDVTGNTLLATGFVYQQRLSNSDGITVILQPLFKMVSVAYTPPQGVPVQSLVLVLDHEVNGLNTTQNYGRGGFSIWVDPLMEPIPYTIRNGTTGVILGTGVLDPAKAVQAPENKNTPVSIVWKGGAVPLLFDANDQISLLGETLRTKVKRQVTCPSQNCADEWKDAMVYEVDLGGQEAAIMLYSFPQSLQIEVREWVREEDGEMPVIAKSKAGNFLSLFVFPGYGKVVITILPSLGKGGVANTTAPFSLYMTSGFSLPGTRGLGVSF